VRPFVWIILGIGAIVAFFAWANRQTRRNRLRTTKKDFVKNLEGFLDGTTSVDDWELFLAHPMGDPELEALRQRWEGFIWEAGAGRDELRDELIRIRRLSGREDR
jgi:hypothetical protein